MNSNKVTTGIATMFCLGFSSVCMAQDLVITQNPACDVDSATMVACGAEGSTAENWFARNFYIDQEVSINSISWGSGNASPVTANVFFSLASGPGNPDNVTLTQVGTATQALDAGGWYETAVDTPFSVPANSYLVVEVQVPDTETNPGIWPSSTTTATETTYLKAADCGLTSYVTVESIGFPEGQMIMCINATLGSFDPCNYPLPLECSADINGDQIVAVSDLLEVISSWGQVGDGTFRPTGDIAPLPDGDCIVSVVDVLAVISSWGEDCRPMGACCTDDGQCFDDVLQDDCPAMDGQYLGDDSLCADSGCGAGACCIDAASCLDGISGWSCSALGGIYRGNDTSCATVSCDASCSAVGCQLPDLLGHGTGGTVGATSDMNEGAGYQVADTFNPTMSGAVSNVCWWGFYIDFGASADCGIDGPGTGDYFTIEYYLDDADGLTPGTLFAGPFSIVSSVAPTGDVIPSGIGDLIQYEYTASHSPVKVMAGQCYWISIYNETVGSCFWLWETAPAGDERSAQNADGWGSNDFDVAFCVDIDTSPGACGAYTGPCCVGEICEILTVSECIAVEGEFKGYNMTCADVNDCQPIPGACCFDQECLDNLSEVDCYTFGGIFIGEGVLCDDTDCTIEPSPYDQIGDLTGGSLGGNTTASQIFEPANAAYDIATLDNFLFDTQETIVSIEAVIDGWNEYKGIEGVTNYTISVYSSVAAAGTDLVGDVYSIDIMTAQFPTWTGPGDLVLFNLNVTLPAGEYWYAVIPWNNFGENGQTGIAGSTLGDGTYYQANPNGGFDFGATQQGDGNGAYRLNVQ